jgi:hypothetical protein
MSLSNFIEANLDVLVDDWAGFASQLIGHDFAVDTAPVAKLSSSHTRGGSGRHADGAIRRPAKRKVTR